MRVLCTYPSEREKKETERNFKHFQFAFGTSLKFNCTTTLGKVEMEFCINNLHWRIKIEVIWGRELGREDIITKSQRDQRM